MSRYAITTITIIPYLFISTVHTSSVSIVRQTHVFNTDESTRQERRERNILYVGNCQNLINQHNLIHTQFALYNTHVFLRFLVFSKISRQKPQK